MKKILFIATTLIASCSSDSDFEKGKKQLVSQGYTGVESTGYEWWCCGKDDSYSTGFIAKDKEGNDVEGCFCSSLGKGITIRFK